MGEECDDGNLDDRDGCSKTGKKEAGWTCIEGIDGKSLCEPLCGDKLIVGNEQCDDGNQINGDRCSRICKIETISIDSKNPPYTNEIKIGSSSIAGLTILSA